MTEETKLNNSQSDVSNDDFQKLLDAENAKIPQAGDIIKGTVLSASKAEVKLDIDGIATGVVRGRELYFEAEEYANLKPGDEVEATIIEEENENGDLELSFRSAGQQKAWSALFDAYENRKILKFRVQDANKGGLLVSYGQIQGFLPVSQLAPENYPRVNGGDKGRILDKLKSFVGAEFEVKVMTLDAKDEKLIVSEKEAWQEKQKDIISKYKVGSVVEGVITALTDFGVFVSFGENLEGLIHISELAWQRIDDPSDLFKVGDKVKAEIISIEGSKIFLSAKKLLTDPWHDVETKYKVGQVVPGTILKVNPFGLFVELDADIHGLAHVSQIGLAPAQKISEVFHPGEKKDFTIVSIEPKDHRLGLSVSAESEQPVAKNKKKEDKKENKEDKDEGEKKAKASSSAKATADKKKVKKGKIDKAEEPSSAPASAKATADKKATEDKKKDKPAKKKKEK
ncbi:MAG: S1 RNA-binding domain-containing protein [Candidatus Falkowbacteria bacterium]